MRRVWQRVAIVVIAGIVAVLLWRLPRWQTAPWDAALAPRDLLLVENELRQTVLLVLAAAAIAAAAAVLWRRAVASERAAQAALELTRETQRVARFTSSVEQLADDRLEVRLGAIYGLEQVAAESAAQHWAVMGVLCAFVRSRATWDPERAEPSALQSEVQAVLTVLGRRNRSRQGDQRLDLRRTDLRGADLNGVNFAGADLSEAHLAGANLQGATLSAATLRGADLRKADLSAADLRGADLRQANLESAYMVEARLDGADLGGAKLADAYLGGAHLEGADLGGAHLDGAYLYKTHLDGASLGSGGAASVPGLQLVERDRASRAGAAVEGIAAVRPESPVTLRLNPTAKPVMLRRRRRKK